MHHWVHKLPYAISIDLQMCMPPPMQMYYCCVMWHVFLFYFSSYQSTQWQLTQTADFLCVIQWFLGILPTLSVLPELILAQSFRHLLTKFPVVLNISINIHKFQSSQFLSFIFNCLQKFFTIHISRDKDIVLKYDHVCLFMLNRSGACLRKRVIKSWTSTLTSALPNSESLAYLEFLVSELEFIVGLINWDLELYLCTEI